MRQLTTKLVVAVALAVTLGSCSTQPESARSASPRETATALPRQTYSNARYGYTVTVPADWVMGTEAANGDGRNLYVGQSDVHIPVFGTHDMGWRSDAATHGFDIQQITLDDGETADLVVGLLDGRAHLEVVDAGSGFDVHFLADTSKAFYDDQRQELFAIAKSLHINPGAALETQTTQPTAAPAPDTNGGNSAELKSLRVAPEAARSGYDRDLFEHWIDADGDGCDTRREVLMQESLATISGGGCSLAGGRWFSAYDGVSTTNSSTFDVDHVVALAEAWDSGANGWSADRRRDFANDLGYNGSLIAVTASSNRSKSDEDPSEWLPPRVENRCMYAATWVHIKNRWALTVDSTEVATLHNLLDACSRDEGGGVGNPPPTVPPQAAPAPTATSAPQGGSCAPSYPDFCIAPPPPDLNCGDVNAKRFTVLYNVPDPDPHRFDGDHDGIGCES